MPTQLKKDREAGEKAGRIREAGAKTITCQEDSSPRWIHKDQ